MTKYMTTIMLIILCGCTKYNYPVSIYRQAREYAHTYSFNYCMSRGNESRACERYAGCVDRQYIKESKLLEVEAHKGNPHDLERGNAFTGLTALFYPYLSPLPENLSPPVEYIRGEPNQSARDSKEVQTFMHIFYDYCGEDVFTLQERCESLAFTGVYPEWCPQGGYEPWKKAPDAEQ